VVEAGVDLSGNIVMGKDGGVVRAASPVGEGLLAKGWDTRPSEA
jgi:hypothetical protein